MATEHRFYLLFMRLLCIYFISHLNSPNNYMKLRKKNLSYRPSKGTIKWTCSLTGSSSFVLRFWWALDKCSLKQVLPVLYYINRVLLLNEIMIIDSITIFLLPLRERWDDSLASILGQVLPYLGLFTHSYHNLHNL